MDAKTARNPSGRRSCRRRRRRRCRVPARSKIRSSSMEQAQPPSIWNRTLRARIAAEHRHSVRRLPGHHRSRTPDASACGNLGLRLDGTPDVPAIIRSLLQSPANSPISFAWRAMLTSRGAPCDRAASSSASVWAFPTTTALRSTSPLPDSGSLPSARCIDGLSGLTAPARLRSGLAQSGLQRATRLPLLPHWQSAFAQRAQGSSLLRTYRRHAEGWIYLRLSGLRRAIAPSARSSLISWSTRICSPAPAAPLQRLVGGLRRLWPRFMRARTLMVGCAAGEGHLDGDEASQSATAGIAWPFACRIARDLNCAMIVLKEFPAKYRAPLRCLRD